MCVPVCTVCMSCAHVSCVWAYLCMCLHLCVNVPMSLCAYACMYCVHLYKNMSMWAHVCIHMSMDISVSIHVCNMCISVCTCVYVHVCAYMSTYTCGCIVCVCVYSFCFGGSTLEVACVTSRCVEHPLAAGVSTAVHTLDGIPALHLQDCRGLTRMLPSCLRGWNEKEVAVGPKAPPTPS